MIKELKKAFAIARYGLRFKTQIVFGLIFLAIGLLVDIFSRGSTYLGGFYIVLSGMFIYQLIISMDGSTLIQSSSYKRKIQTKYPFLAVIPVTAVFFTIIVVIHSLMAFKTYPDISAVDNYNRQGLYILTMGAMMMLTMIYFGICYKYFMVGMLLLFVMVMPLSTASSMLSNWAMEQGREIFKLYFCIPAAYILFAIGAVLMYVLSVALYKKPLSKLAVRVKDSV